MNQPINSNEPNWGTPVTSIAKPTWLYRVKRTIADWWDSLATREGVIYTDGRIQVVGTLRGKAAIKAATAAVRPPPPPPLKVTYRNHGSCSCGETRSQRKPLPTSTPGRGQSTRY